MNTTYMKNLINTYKTKTKHNKGKIFMHQTQDTKPNHVTKINPNLKTNSKANNNIPYKKKHSQILHAIS